MLEPIGEIGANFSLQFSSPQFAKIKNKKDIPENQCEKHKKIELSIICIVSIKIRFKAIHHLQSLENLRFLLPPLILRLYTGCSLDQNFSRSTIGFQKVKD